MARFRLIIISIIILNSLFLFNCSALKNKKKANRPYAYGWVPKKYEEIKKHYDNYSFRYNCQPGETIASIGAGNGKFEVTISCFVPGINWYLQEIDSSRLNQFDDVLAHFEKIKGSAINANFNLVLGTTTTTNLESGIFDRILLINVFHEINDRKPIMEEVIQLLKPDGKLVIMERMGDKQGMVHGDCKFPKLYEPDLLEEMNTYGFTVDQIQDGEKVSMMKIYSFKTSS